MRTFYFSFHDTFSYKRASKVIPKFIYISKSSLDLIPISFIYLADTIIMKDGNDIRYIKYRHRNIEADSSLTDEEKKQFLWQVLKSEEYL